jgi:ABC-2 type transport system ATP-binding protein
LLGPNGAGKTTTVEMLEGLRQPDSGSLEVLGIDVARHPDALKERIGVALQTAELYPKLTVVEVLNLFRSFYQRSSWTISARGRRPPRFGRSVSLAGSAG